MSEKTAGQTCVERLRGFTKALESGDITGFKVTRARNLGNSWVSSEEIPADELRFEPIRNPQYRPFTPEEALKQGGREIVRKTNRWKTPFYVGTDRIVVPDFLCTTSHSFSDLLEKFVFSDDGSPCGVRID